MCRALDLIQNPFVAQITPSPYVDAALGGGHVWELRLRGKKLSQILNPCHSKVLTAC